MPPKSAAKAPPPVTPQKRKRQSEMPASVAKRIRKEAKGSCVCSPGDKAAIDADNAKMDLNKYVKSLAATVDADWHDSYEETAEELEEYFQDCGKRVQNVLRVGVKCGQEFGECHETLKQVADTWSNIQAIPFRGDPGDDLSNGEGVTLFENGTGDDDDQDSCNGEGAVHCPVELLEIVWPALIARAAGDEKVPDKVLMQMIKDAVDHGLAEPCVAGGAISNIKMMLKLALQKHLMRGEQRVVALISRQEEWKAMASTKKVHKMRRCIDRRFDGPKHLRTRDYDSGSEGGCSLM